MENTVCLKQVVKRYGEFVLGPIDLDFPKGCITGLIGPNGAGKTTTLKIIMNILKPNSGEITVLDMKHRKSEIQIKNKIGYVGEVQYYYEDRTVAWTSSFISKFYNNWDCNLFDRLTHEFEINRTKKIKNLSKGMRVKLSIAIALSHNPDLIIMDEPTSGLDPVIRREVLSYLRKFVDNNNDKSVIISSHITDDLERIADYVVFLIDGKVALHDEKDILSDKWKKISYKKEALDEAVSSKLINVEKNMFGSSGYTDKYSEIKDSIAHLLKSEELKIENVGLDDILICLMRRR